MRIAVISDVHANLHALRAVLARLDEIAPDQLVCLGDVVGYGPEPGPCLELVAEHCDVVVRGNHEEAVTDPRIAAGFNGAAREAIHWTHATLSHAHKRYVANLPAMARCGPDLEVLCVHDSPSPGPTDYLHDRSSASIAFRGVDVPVCVVGHTHVPMVFETAEPEPESPLSPHDLASWAPRPGEPYVPCRGGRVIANPGSVGQPRDADPRASFALIEFDGARPTFTVHREAYDVAAAQRDSLAAGLPGVLSQRLAIGA